MNPPKDNQYGNERIIPVQKRAEAGDKLQSVHRADASAFNGKIIFRGSICPSGRVKQFTAWFNDWFKRGCLRKHLNLGIGFFLTVWPMATEAFQDANGSNLLSIAEFQSKIEKHGRAFDSFQIEGVVCATVPQRNLVVLQDASATVLLELPSVSPSVSVGDWLAVSGNHCRLTRTRYGIQVGTAPVVDNDGIHSALAKDGSVFLEAGMAPIRLEWFNRLGDFALNLEYAGPQVRKQKVPAKVLWHHPAGSTNLADLIPGVNYSAYTGTNWFAMPDCSRLNPVAKGVTTNFSLAYRTQDENCALVFDGFIQIEHAGKYNFRLTSDDGSRLYVANPSSRCEVVSLGRKSIPQANRLSATRASQTSQWTTVEGEITFVGLNDLGVELELVLGAEMIQVLIVGEYPASPAGLLHQHVRMTGICEASHDLEQKQAVRMVIPNPKQFQIQVVTNEALGASALGNDTLTLVGQIQRLLPEQAQKKLPVRIKGVITHTGSEPAANLGLQDATGGVYVRYFSNGWTDQPQVGDLWELEGTTDPGEFSPIVIATRGKYLGNATMPEPIHPTWDQLINGSLDARYIEISGFVISYSGLRMVVVTPDGKINLNLYEMRRYRGGGNHLMDNNFTGLSPDEVSASYVGSVVRIRGCVAAIKNTNTRQINIGELNLVGAVVSVEEPAPANPFALPMRKAADLLLFDPHASMLQRTKLAGQLVYAQLNEYLVQDGLTGFRVQTESALQLTPGALVEAVGFPQLGGPSVVLLMASIRQTGMEPLPVPISISKQNLLDQKLDATVVRTEAMLLNDVDNQDGRVLELQAGPYHFLAKLKLRFNSPPQGSSPLLPGSQLQLTGVYSSAQKGRIDGRGDAFELLLNNVADIVVLRQPSWWTVRHTVTVIAALASGLLLTLVWITLLRRKIEERTVQLKHEIEERQLVEHRRIMETERSRVAQDLHDELGCGLTEMGMLGDLVNNPGVPPAEKNGYLSQITDTARSLVTSLDEIVWAVNPNYDSVASVASYYILFAQRFLELAGIACRPQIPSDFKDCLLVAKERHGLFLAFKEALNNIVRHSGATEVQVKIDVSDRELIIMVADNGHGFDTAAPLASGEGLSGMRRRVKDFGGSCVIRSQSGTGTEVEFRLPLGNVK